MKKKFLSSSSLLSVMAILVSLGSMFVYVYQARIMQEQQKASSWPYIEALPSRGPQGLSLIVTNKGTGPAIVKNVILRLGDEEFKSLDSLFKAVTDSSFADFGYSTVNRRVIAPGEMIEAFMITDEEIGNRISKVLSTRGFEYEICYCSIYKDCWTSKGLDVSESTCE